jgi:hypothetical protein
MSRRRSGARALAVALAVGLVLAVVAVAAPNRSIESKTFSLVDSVKSGASIRCPHGLRATGGGFSAPLPAEFPSGIESAVDAPAGRSRWRADLLSFDPDRKAKVWAVCAKAPGAKTVRSKTAFTSGSQYALAAATCPRHTKLIGGGAETKGPRRMTIIVSAPGTTGPARTRRSWAAVASTTQPASDQSLVAFAICQSHAGKVKVRFQTKAAGPGRPAEAALRDSGPRRGTSISDTFRLDCPGGFELTSGGFASADVNAAYDAVRPRGNTWNLDVRHYQNSQPVTAYAVCRKG